LSKEHHDNTLMDEVTWRVTWASHLQVNTDMSHTVLKYDS